MPNIKRVPASLIPTSFGEGVILLPLLAGVAVSSRGPRCAIWMCYVILGWGTAQSSKWAPRMASRTGKEGGSRCLGGPQLPRGPHGPLPFLGAVRSSIPSPARSSLPACLSKRFLLLTKYQELGFVYDFWIKYGRKGVSPPGSR